MEQEPFLISIDETQKMIGVGRTKVYQLMDDRELESVKIGDRRLITMPSIKKMIERLLEDPAAAPLPADEGAEAPV